MNRSRLGIVGAHRLLPPIELVLTTLIEPLRHRAPIESLILFRFVCFYTIFCDPVIIVNVGMYTRYIAFVSC